MFDRQKLFSTNWDDLKYFLMLMRTGRLSLAAKELGTTHATISNRISSLEKSLGIQLFIHGHHGFHLTQGGEKFARYAEECERQLTLALEDYSTDDRMRSKIRIGVTEGLGDNYLSLRIARWMRNQNLNVDFISLPKTTSITSREADISITLERPKGEYVIRRNLTDYTLGIYASPEYVTQHQRLLEEGQLADHLWIGYIDSMMFAKALNYHREISSELKFAFNSTSIRSQQQAARAGLGLSILPDYMVRGDLNLTRVFPWISFTRQYWISTTKDIHRFQAVKITWDYILRLCKLDQPIFNHTYK